MTAPRVQIDLAKLEHNARTLVARLASVGISVTGVTKATLGSPDVAGALWRAGVAGLGDSRIENIEAMRRAGVSGPMTLIRSPMPSQVGRVVASADVSFNTEPDVIEQLSGAAGERRLTHGIVLMVELGDLREGIMPSDVETVARHVLGQPHLVLRGIGANLACQNGVVPDASNMAELSALADSLEATLGVSFDIVSGGNSGNLAWALRDADDGVGRRGDRGAEHGDGGGAGVGRINDLRLGESILLGREPLHRQPIDGLHGDVFTLVAEVIESKVKPSQPWGSLGQSAFDNAPPPVDRGDIRQAILAIGHQDADPAGLVAPPGVEILGASSDHLVVAAGRVHLRVGAELTFGLNYSALVRAMTSPFVAKVVTSGPTGA